MEENMEAKILAFIDRIRPFLVSDGGNIEFVKWEDGIVYVKLLGACAGCSLMDVTLKNGIEQLMVEEIEGVKEVRNVL